MSKQDVKALGSCWLVVWEEVSFTLMGIKFLAFYLKEPDTPSVQLVKSQVNELVLRAQAQKAFGVAENCTPLHQTQSASNSVGQEGVRRKTCPKNSFR